MVVGDDDQSIYSWRGADIRNILEFERDYPEASVVRLEENYRSTATILAAANAVVANNTGRKPKTLWTANAGGEAISRYYACDERDESRLVATEIERVMREEGRSYADFVIFYRTHAQSPRHRRPVPARWRAVPDRGRDAVLRSRGDTRRDGVPQGDREPRRRGLAQAHHQHAQTRHRQDQRRASRVRGRRARASAFDEAVDRAGEWLGAGPSRKVAAFVELMTELRAVAADGGALRDLVEEIVERSGLLQALQAERTFESEGRIENIKEFFGVVEEFDAQHESAGACRLHGVGGPAHRSRLDAGGGARGHAHDAAHGQGTRVSRRLHRRHGGHDLPARQLDVRGVGTRGGAPAVLRGDHACPREALPHARVTRAASSDSRSTTRPAASSARFPRSTSRRAALARRASRGTGFARRGDGSRGSSYGFGRGEGRVFGAGAPASRQPRPAEDVDSFEVGDRGRAQGLRPRYRS